MTARPGLVDVGKFPVTAGVALLAAFVTVVSIDRDIDAFTMSAAAFRTEPWRLLTATLPHGGPLHLIFNLLWLWTFGTVVELTWGHARTLAIFVVLAIGSSAAEYGLVHGGIGLSGVGYGLFGMLWVLAKTKHPQFRDVVDQRTTVLFVVWFFLCIAATALGTARIGNVAHGAGALLGACLGMAVVSRGPRKIAAIAATIALLAASLASATVLRPLVNFSDRPNSDSDELGFAALQAGRNEEALVHYRRAIADDKPWTWHNYGLALSRTGDDEGALEAYRRAYQADETSAQQRGVLARHLAYLAVVAHAREDFARAVALYEESLALVADSATEQDLAAARAALAHDEAPPSITPR